MVSFLLQTAPSRFSSVHPIAAHHRPQFMGLTWLTSPAACSLEEQGVKKGRRGGSWHWKVPRKDWSITSFNLLLPYCRCHYFIFLRRKLRLKEAKSLDQDHLLLSNQIQVCVVLPVASIAWTMVSPPESLQQSLIVMTRKQVLFYWYTMTGIQTLSNTECLLRCHWFLYKCWHHWGTRM